MSQDSRLSVHDNIWHFSVTDPQLHKKGYTVYKVTCKTFPIKSPETLTEVICWKRYNDFKTLYKALHALHKALHRRDQFPIFAKPKLFGRFDETVIEERRLSAVELLNFVATQPHLYKSLVFKQFLEDGKEKRNFSTGSALGPKPSTLDILSSGPQAGGNPPPDLVPTMVPSSHAHRNLDQGQSADVSPELLQSVSADHGATANGRQNGGSNKSPDALTEVAMLDGTWNYPQVADNISLDSSTGDETVDSDDESILASSLPDADLAFFDPLPHDQPATTAEETGGNMPRSNSWLLTGLNMCAEIDSQPQAEETKDEGSELPSLHGPETTKRKDTMLSTDSTLTTSGSTPSSSTLDRLTTDADSASDSRKDSLGDSSTITGHGTDLEEFDPLRKMSQSSDSSRVECGRGDLDLSTEWQSRSASVLSPVSTSSQRLPPTNVEQQKEKPRAATLPSKPTSQVSSRSQSLGSEKSEDSEKAKSNSSTPKRSSRSMLRKLVSGSPGSHKPRSGTEQSVSTMDLGGKEDYIYLAASQICMAQNSEANGDYEVAFAYYKSGVGILLQGVQGDTNKGRRDAVRRKTAQYLMKAEDLFNRHLATEKVDERRWGADSFLSPSLDLDPSFAFIRGSVRELRSFQVLGTIDKVILVRDKTTDETYVIKSIAKSTPDIGRTQSILPTSCPHMVSLHKFYETDSTVFLLLQYASGGKLWTYIGDYLSQDKPGHADAGIELGAVHCQADQRNIYSGTKIENEGENSESSQSEAKTDAVSMKDVQSVKKSTSGLNNVVQNVQSSHDKGVIRFSSLRKDSNVDGGDLNTDSPAVYDKETDDTLPETVDTSLTLSQNPPKTPVGRRFSSLSDDCCQVQEGDSSVISPSTLLEEDHFQMLLQEHRANLANFSINSLDSEEPAHRHSSSFVERADSILEASEDDVDIASSKQVASRQISADEVFQITRREDSHGAAGDSRVRHCSTDGVFPTADAKRFASSFKADDIIQSSRQLLNEVEKVLSETDDRGTEGGQTNRNSSISEEGSSSASGVKDSSSACTDSNEEPSIYDINRSSEDDTSDQASTSNSDDKNLDSPTSDNVKKLSSSPEEELSSTAETPEDMTLPCDSDIVSGLGGVDEKQKLRHSSGNSLFRQTTTPHKLSISRMDSKDMTRSASFECDLKSPTRNRARTVSNLFERLDSSGTEQVRLPEASVRKWVAHLVTAVSRLHSLGIICRDLKPSNVLLGDGGQVYLTYFCHLGHGEQETDWEAVEMLYAAPEIGSIGGYDMSCDWWSIGALLYELVVGRSLCECHPGGINPHTCLHVPSFVSPEARSLLEGLLTFYPHERLGSGMAGAEEIKAHPFFAGVDWHTLEYSS
ncbi:ribosomal protein S6 kinase delta-1 [Aplysia californica]|uniref:Ribosomal protein S6 kinase delta-1 n=1 Tax=Aplysia californica TaxID=6500 RepID=A0ABM0K295_APLCA|nr:ribosomal protein S6 kinase delta-1 [Aplysia californica]